MSISICLIFHFLKCPQKYYLYYQFCSKSYSIKSEFIILLQKTTESDPFKPFFRKNSNVP